MSYFQRVNALTPTRFWINNPTLEEADAALAAGAISCTTNPTYVAKMASRNGDRERIAEAVDVASSRTTDRNERARLVQRAAVTPLLRKFERLYDDSNGRAGFVSIQGDPLAEDDPAAIIEEANADMALGRNVIAKIPVTEAGLEAINTLVRRDVPVIATEVMAIAQVVAVCEVYERASHESGKRPALYVTHITGIFDEYLAMLQSRHEISVDPDILLQAGTAVARKQLRLMRERNYPGVFLGGGARALEHFTEFVGEPAHVTINWNGTAESLIDLDPPVVPRAGCRPPDSFVDELLRRVPDFARAYAIDGLSPSEFADYGPVELFRSRFIDGWNKLLELVQ